MTRHVAAALALALTLVVPARAQAPEALLRLTLSELPRSHRRPGGTPAAVAVVGTGPRVVFLHGWRGCAAILAGSGEVRCHPDADPEPGWGLAARVSASSYPHSFLVPQLAFRRRSSDPGRFAQAGYVERFMAGVDSELARDHGVASTSAPTILAAHSAGFATALAWLRHGGAAAERVRAVILFDALYSGTQAFADWLAADESHVLVSFYGRGGAPRRQNRRLRGLVARAGLPIAESLDAEGARLYSIHTRTPHGDIPSVHFAEALDRLGPLTHSAARTRAPAGAGR